MPFPILKNPVVVFGGLIGLGLLLGLFMARGSYNSQGYVLVALVITILALFVLIPRVAKGEGKLFAKVLVLAFFLKAGASMFRLIWGIGVKEGRIDANRYHRTGKFLAERFWQGDFAAFEPFLTRGTRMVEATTGVIYSVIGPTLHGGFLFFAFLAFIGSCFYYRAFRLAFPDGNRWIYAGLIFFYPSWLYWPSSIGKDALLVFLVGLTTYGLAKWLRQGSIMSLGFLVVGLVGAYWIRPHIAAFLIMGIGAALVFRRYRIGIFTPIASIATVGAVVLLGFFVLTKASSFVGIDEFTLSDGNAAFDDIQRRAFGGGAAFEPVNFREPLGVPKAIITILYRPFPWEAHRGAALVLSMEGVFFLMLTIWRFGSIKKALWDAKSDPFLIFILVYSAVCIIAFSSFGNFSIVGRQRLQFLPVFFMLLSYQRPVKETVRAVLPRRSRALKARFFNKGSAPAGTADQA